MTTLEKIFPLWLIIGLTLYATSLSSNFVFDDGFIILNNPAVLDISNIPFMWQAFSTRFLPGLSFALNFSAGGFNPVDFRLVNIILHLAVSLLIYAFVKLLFSTPNFLERAIASSKDTIALVASFIFLVHPLQVESVVYIAQRATLLMALFYLLSLVLYMQYRLTGQKKFLAAALLSTLLGMFSKETTFTLPFAVIMCELFFFCKKARDLQKSFKRLLPFVCLMGIIPLLLLFESPYSVLKVGTIVSANSLDFTRVLTEINILRTYLRLLIFPFHQNLDYDYPLSQGILEPSTLFSIGLLVILLILAKVFYKSKRMVSFCILWFFLTVIIPALSCAFQNQEGMIFEHYLYLPMAGFSIFLPYILFELLKDKKRVKIIAAAFIAIFFVLTAQRNFIWADTERLLNDTITKSPKKTRPYYMLASYYLQEKEYERAKDVIFKALALDPDNVRNFYNLGVIYEAQGKIDEAIEQYKKAVSTDFAIIRAYAYFNLAYLYEKKEDFSKAESYYWESLFSDPRIYGAYSNLGNVYMMQKKYPQAVTMYEKILQINPHHRDARNGLASAYVMMGEHEEGMAEYKKNIVLYPNDLESYKNLAKTYFLKKEFALAEEFFEKALTIDKNDAESYRYLARIFSELNKKEEAAENLAKAVQILKENKTQNTVKDLGKQYPNFLE